MATMQVRDANDVIIDIEMPVVEPATEAKQDVGNSSLVSIDSKISDLKTYNDGLEALMTSLNGYVDGLEALVTSGNATSTSIAGYVDGLEALVTTLNGLLTTQAGYVDGLETLITATNAALAASTPAGTALIGKVDHSTTGIADGRTVVATAGTRVVLLAATVAKWVTITAETDNTGIVVVGGATCVAALATRRGTPLAAGESATFPVDNLGDISLDSMVSGDGVTFTYGT